MGVAQAASRQAFARLVALLLGIILLACKASQGSDPAHPDAGIPQGEVWLTETQVRALDLQITPVSEQVVEDVIRTAGRVAFDDSRVTHVYSPVSGRISRIDARVGQHVVKGQSLALIQAPDLGTATSDLRKAEADEKAARIDVLRQQTLVTQGAAAVHDLDVAQATEGVALAERQRAQERVRLLLGGQRSNVAQTYTVRAEIEGNIMTRGISPGVEVQGLSAGGAPTELFMIGNIDRVWILADIFEIDVGRVRQNAPVAIHVVAFPDHVYHGTIDWISQMLNPTTRTAQLRVVLDNDPAYELRPEMFATATLQVDPVKALSVSSASTVRVGETTFVFVEYGKTADGRLRFKQVPIVLDPSMGTAFHPVLHGLEAGQRIVTNNAIQLMGML